MAHFMVMFFFLVGRNLFFFSKDAEDIDPEVSARFPLIIENFFNL